LTCFLALFPAKTTDFPQILQFVQLFEEKFGNFEKDVGGGASTPRNAVPTALPSLHLCRKPFVKRFLFS